MKKIRVLIADDHLVVRAGLRSLLDEFDDIEVVGEASCGDEVLASIAAAPPDVVLLDITMPNTVATECIEKILAASPATRVLVLTMHDDPLYLRSVLAAGATGYLTKSVPPSTLLEGIRAVRAGRRFVAAEHVNVDAAVPAAKISPAIATAIEAAQLAELSPRERQVLALLARGHTYQEIADALQVSSNSVGTYRSRIATKLRVDSRADLVRLAFELGLVDPAN